MASTKRKASGELVSPPPKRTHQGNYEFVERAIPRRRTQSPPPTSSPRAAPQSSSAPRRPPGSPTSRPARLLASPSVSASSTEDEEEDDEDPVLCRIQSGIAYVRDQQHKHEAIMQTTRFEVSATSSSTALSLLRRYATPIYTSSDHELYELGVPRPDWVTEGILPGLHDPQWWLNKTAAEVKAGPHAEESDVKRAAANLKGLQTKKNKKKGPTAREKEIEWKLEEGTRRQEMGLKMWGSDSEETGESSDGEEESRESEDDGPVRRGVRQRGRRWMPTIEEESDNDSDSEDDLPILRDPRYLQFLSR